MYFHSVRTIHLDVCKNTSKKRVLCYTSVIQYIFFVYKCCCYVFTLVRHRQTDLNMLFVILATFSRTDPVFKNVKMPLMFKKCFCCLVPIS